MKIEREALLHAVRAASLAASKDGAIDQSDRLLFQNGRIFTYNDYMACSVNSPLSIEGAVRAQELTQLLERLPENELDVEVDKNHLRVKGDKRLSKVAMEHSFRLKVAMERPEQWEELPPEFVDAVDVVTPCAAKSKSSKFIVRCVRVGPEGLSATDNSQLVRASISMPTKDPFLVLPDTLESAAYLGCCEMGVTKNWAHFRNQSGVVLSGRRHDLTFPPFREVLGVEGKKAKLPDNLKEAIDTAAIFAEGSTKDARIKISIRGSKIRISGKGPHGEYMEEQETTSRMKADFYTTPQLMTSLLKKSSHCEVVPGKMLIVRGGFYDYATSLVKEK